jgi:hypothetical protein
LMTSSAIDRPSDSSRASGAARSVSARTLRMMCSALRVLKKSIAESARCASAKNCSSSALVGGGVALRGGGSTRVASPAARWSS